MLRRFARAALDIVRLTFAREKLGDASGSVPRPPPRAPSRFLRMLVAIEELPMDPPAPPRARSRHLASLLAPERLPMDPEPLPKAPGPARLRLRSLLAPEPLPLDPVPPPRRRPSRLAALFAPESLDDR